MHNAISKKNVLENVLDYTYKLLKLLYGCILVVLLFVFAAFVVEWWFGSDQNVDARAPWSLTETTKTQALPGIEPTIIRLSEKEFTDARQAANRTGFLFNEDKANPNKNFGLMFINPGDRNQFNQAKKIIKNAQSSDYFSQIIVLPALSDINLDEKKALLESMQLFDLFCVDGVTSKNNFCFGSAEDRAARLKVNSFLQTALGLNLIPSGANSDLLLIAPNGYIGWVDTMVDDDSYFKTLNEWFKENTQINRSSKN